MLKEDSRGAQLAKEHKDNKRRIDAAVAAVVAHDRAAILAGDRGPSSYIKARRDGAGRSDRRPSRPILALPRIHSSGPRSSLPARLTGRLWCPHWAFFRPCPKKGTSPSFRGHESRP
jgi:hypothetical protein